MERTNRASRAASRASRASRAAPLVSIPHKQSSLSAVFSYLSSTTFTQLSHKTPSLPGYYKYSCFPYALVGILLLLYPLFVPDSAKYTNEGYAWIGVALTSHIADVTYFGVPGANVVVDSLWAPTCMIISIYNTGLVAAACTVPIPLFFFLRGQMDDPMNERKIADHARWHWLGQGLRVAVLVWQNPPTR